MREGNDRLWERLQQSNESLGDRVHAVTGIEIPADIEVVAHLDHLLGIARGHEEIFLVHTTLVHKVHEVPDFMGHVGAAFLRDRLGNLERICQIDQVVRWRRLADGTMLLGEVIKGHTKACLEVVAGDGHKVILSVLEVQNQNVLNLVISGVHGGNSCVVDEHGEPNLRLVSRDNHAHRRLDPHPRLAKLLLVELWNEAVLADDLPNVGNDKRLRHWLHVVHLAEVNVVCADGRVRHALVLHLVEIADDALANFLQLLVENDLNLNIEQRSHWLVIRPTHLLMAAVKQLCDILSLPQNAIAPCRCSLLLARVVIVSANIILVRRHKVDRTFFEPNKHAQCRALNVQLVVH
eukprot:Opistho-2@21652